MNKMHTVSSTLVHFLSGVKYDLSAAELTFWEP